MKWILWFLLFTILFSLMVFLYFQGPGYVNISWIGYEIEFTVVVGLLYLVFFFFILIYILRFFSWLVRILFGKRTLSSKKVEQTLLGLLSAYEAENFSEALRLEKKAAQRLKDNPFYLWISGHLFEKIEKPFEAEQSFMELTKNTSTVFLGLKGKIRAALQRRDLITAFDLLQYAQKIMPGSPWVLKHLLALAREKMSFEEAQALIFQLTDLGYVSFDNSKKQLAHLYYQQAIQEVTSTDQKEVLLRQAHELDPGLSQVTEVFAPLLEGKGHTTYAIMALEATWILSPTQKQGDLYLEISKPKGFLEAYEKAKKFVKSNPKHPESLLLLARTALVAQLWGEARAHLTQLLLLKQEATATVYQLLAQLEKEEHQDMKAAMAWLEKGIQAPRHV